MNFKIKTPVSFSVEDGKKVIVDADKNTILIVPVIQGEYGKYEEAEIIKQTIEALNRIDALEKQVDELLNLTAYSFD